MTDTNDEVASASTIDELVALLERDHSAQERVKRFVRWLAISVAFDIALSLGLIFFGIAQHSAANDLCHAEQRSWTTRARTAEIITTPTELSPNIERLFGDSELTTTLRLQIKSTNALRAQQRAELVKANGPRPNC